MSVHGTLIAESLTAQAVLTVPLTVTRVQRLAVDRTAAHQPPVWTLIDFSCAEADAERLAGQLAASLVHGPWYVDMTGDTTKYVVFAGKTFVFARTDSAANAVAVAHGRSVGVLLSQLDWPL